MAVGDRFIYRTADGGQSWTQVLNINGYFFTSVAFSSATNGVAVGSYSTDNNGVIYRTQDGGQTWTNVFSN